jgi:hypothetical protein
MGIAVFISIWVLFALAIVSIWVFPNKKISDNEHDVKH